MVNGMSGAKVAKNSDQVFGSIGVAFLKDTKLISRGVLGGLCDVVHRYNLSVSLRNICDMRSSKTYQQCKEV